MAFPETVSITFEGMTVANGTYILSLISETEFTAKWYLEIDYGIKWISLEIDINPDPAYVINQLTFKYQGAYLDFVFVGNYNELPIWRTSYENQWSPETGTATVDFGPPRAINPTPVDGAVNVSKNITTFTWEILE